MITGEVPDYISIVLDHFSRRGWLRCRAQCLRTMTTTWGRIVVKACQSVWGSQVDQLPYAAPTENDVIYSHSASPQAKERTTARSTGHYILKQLRHFERPISSRISISKALVRIERMTTALPTHCATSACAGWWVRPCRSGCMIRLSAKL